LEAAWRESMRAPSRGPRRPWRGWSKRRLVALGVAATLVAAGLTGFVALRLTDHGAAGYHPRAVPSPARLGVPQQEQQKRLFNDFSVRGVTTHTTTTVGAPSLANGAGVPHQTAAQSVPSGSTPGNAGTTGPAPAPGSGSGAGADSTKIV